MHKFIQNESVCNTLIDFLHLLTYLNDDFEGGMTTFSHYDLVVKLITGLALIWPTEWTHAHQGQINKKGSKNIITGWLNSPIALI